MLVACQQVSQQLRAAPPTPPIPSRAITQSDPAVQESWRVSPLLVVSNGQGQFAQLVQAPGKIVGRVNRFLDNEGQIAAFSTSTGKLEWNIQGVDFVSSITADQERVYIAVAGEPIRAYNLSNGELVWSGPNLLPRRSYFLHIQDGLLFNYFTGTIQQINVQTGELQSEDQEEEITNSPVVWRSKEFDLRHVWQRSSILVKVKQGTTEVEWYTAIDEDSHWIRYFPFLYSDRLVMVAGETDPDIYVVDFETGQRLWKADDTFVSNVAVVNDKVYALRDDARLLVFDLDTGTELGYIQFTPAETDLSSKTYWVGVNEEGRIFVYFSDSEELFGLITVTE